VALDDAVAEAHFALADIMTWTDWDWAGAEREWKRTIELNPSYPEALATYSHFLNIMGRPEEAMTQIKRALELDPFNVIIQGFYAVDLLFMRQYDEAIVQARNVLRTAPGHPLAVSALWVAIRHKGMDKEMLAVAKDYFAFYGDADVDKALEKAYTEGDYAGAMSRAAKALAASSLKIHVVPTDVAELYLEAGDKDRALEWLEKGFEARDPIMPYLGLPQYDPLRSDPRFQDLLRRMNLPVDEKK
jgi:serine/threonine-protein kinase